MRVLVVAVLLLVPLSGCVTETDKFYGFDPDEHYRNPGVFEGHYEGGLLLNPGNLTALAPSVVRLKSTLPAYGGLVDSGDADVDIVMAIWRPANVTEPVPIIVDAGPYFEVGCRVNENPCPPDQLLRIDVPSQTTPFNVGNFLPHGYAVVQLAVRGTGTAGGCFDLMGPSEVHDLDQAITWLGEQEWSNGRIAMVGASYDGSTSWQVAATGNPYLKTIFPAAGLPDIYDLMFHNGSAETRGAIMHNTVYWGYGFHTSFPQPPPGWPENVPWIPPMNDWGLPPNRPGPNPSANGRQEYQDRQNLLCPEVVEGTALGQYSVVMGDRADEASTYWAERDYRQRVLQNYKGSVFLIHGLQDWNVDPHAAIPFNQRLKDAGIPVKEWYGQWGHTYPDGTCSGDAPAWVVLPCRIDFAEVMYRWLERELKGNMTIDVGPMTQVQDNIGFWRNADSYPPADPDWVEFRLSSDGRLAQGKATDGQVELMPATNGGTGPVVQLISDPLPDGLHMSGLPQIKLPFDVEGQGGHIAAWMFDVDPNGLVRAMAAGQAPSPTDPNQTIWRAVGTPVVGHAQMNLRFYAGGEEPQVLVPQQRYVAQVEFEPLEVRIPAGHRVGLWLFQFHYGEHQDSPTRAKVTLHFDQDAKLRLPSVDVDPRTVFPVPGAHFLNRTYVREMYVPMPSLPSGFEALLSYGEIPTSQDVQALRGKALLPIGTKCLVCT